MDLVARHHPTEITMVHPAVGGGPGSPGPEYGSPDGEEAPVTVTVDGRDETVRVLRFSGASPLPDLPPVTLLLLEHPLFLQRTKKVIYPNPMTRVEVLSFFSLWNQAVGELLARRRPDVFHCPDFHTALAPWYAVPSHPKLRLLLVLHNAEYQGSISTDQIRGLRLERMARIFNWSTGQVSERLVLDGRFNMLKAAVDFLLRRQRGLGACAVSDHYALEVRQLYGLLWRLPAVRGLENPMLEEERPMEYSDLQARRKAAKAAMQRELGLREDERAKLFVSLGRLVRQKGVDLLADVARELLERYPSAQLVIVGPVADGFGHYASHHLAALSQDFEGRVFVKCEFMKVGNDLRFAADFCLMPSRDEPFGYVDVEFAWCGALVVGAQAGGLGKVPGFYYIAQNRENLRRLRRELLKAIASAMAAPEEQLLEMSSEAVRCTFPLQVWQRRLCELYAEVLQTRPADPEREADVERPRPAPRPAGRGAPRLAHGRVTMSDVASQHDAGGGLASFGASFDVRVASDGMPTAPEEEFLTQELSEEELQEKMARRMSLKGIDLILESVGCEVDESRETDPVAKWLLRPLLGTHRIHWVVACGYVMAPLAEVFSFTVASEWGLRAGGSSNNWLPSWMPGKWREAVGGTMDPSLLHVILFSCNALALSGSSIWWTMLCKRHEPRWVLAGALLSHLLLLVGLLPFPPTVLGAAALMLAHGWIGGASMLFVVFNFVMSIRADMSQAALRMGRLETARYCVSWLATGYVYLAAPNGVPGTAADPLPAKVLLLVAPLGVLFGAASCGAGALCAFAPRPYREDRFPAWDPALIGYKRSFVLLAASECIGSLLAFPALSYASWWLANGWRANQLAEVSCVLAVVLSVGVMLWAQVLSMASVHGFSLLISVAVFLLPPSLLAAVCQQEVSTFDYRGKSMTAMVVCAITLLMQGMQSSAIWAAKIRILGSRWRLLSYCTILLSVSQFCTFLSPIMCELIARRYSVSFLTRNQEELAMAVTACVVPLAIAQYLVQLMAALFIHGDMGSARHRAAAPPGGPGRWCAGRVKHAAWRPIALSVLLGLVLLGCTAARAYGFLYEPIPFSPVRRCRNPEEDPSWLQCQHLQDEIGPQFQLNRYGQNTTAKLRCYEFMEHAGGDTFDLRDVGKDGGTCVVLKCERGSKGAGWNGLFSGEVYSRHCSVFGQSLVITHLFEWAWADVARECTHYLGPAGFDAVQVSPPAEHMLGSPWFTRYQPVSYRLDSRSGTEEEFVDMVAECRAAGVAVMVDAVINHMASKALVWPEGEDLSKPFECNNSLAEDSNLTCRGWSGTRFGDRSFPGGAPGNTQYARSEFHHYNDNLQSNCALPPWTNNRHLCDLQGLPDLDTEQQQVRDKLGGFLKHMYEIGVTMLRIDAAMLMYPASLGGVLQDIPLDYAVQEYYPGVLAVEERTLRDATTISAITDFQYGWSLSGILFDSWDGGKGAWAGGEGRFGQLLDLNSGRTRFPDEPVRASQGLQFLDNHDQQRERWKACQRPGDAGCRTLNATCPDPTDGQCRPIYKHGALYHVALAFSLAWPFGDSFRVMSSYSWASFRQGPPGTRANASRDAPLAVWAPSDGERPSRCKLRPEQSPVSEAYDDDEAHPWVCEHRWRGVAGLVRLRKQLATTCGANWHLCSVGSRGAPGSGRAHFSVVAKYGPPQTFVALSRGFNVVTGLGSNTSWTLIGLNSTLPEGEYCDMASLLDPVRAAGPGPSWPAGCQEVVRVAPNGTITEGIVRSGGALAIHRLFRRPSHGGGRAAERLRAVVV